MKKNFQKILTFLFFFSLVFSFTNFAKAATIPCEEDEDCNSPLLFCKITPPQINGACAMVGSGQVVDSNTNISNSSVTESYYWNLRSSSASGAYAGLMCKDKDESVNKSICREKNIPTNGIITSDLNAFCCKKVTTVITKEVTDLNPLGNLQVKIPGLDDLAKKHPATCDTDEQGQTKCTIPWVAIYIKAIYNYMLLVGGIAAVIALMIGGVIWLVSTGNATRISEAKSWIFGSVTGIIILLSSYILLNQINPKLTELKSLELKTIEPVIAETELTSAIDYTGGSLYPSSQWIQVETNPNIVNKAAGRTNPELAKAIISAAKCMKTLNYKIEIRSLSRTVSKQIEIYDNNYTHEPNKCGTLNSGEAQACCPYPTGSKLCPHTSGNAADLWGLNEKGIRSVAAQQKLQECMITAGACVLNTECWHFELPALSSICTKNKNLNGSFCQDLAK